MVLGCNDNLKDPAKEEAYTGPIIENKDALTLFSDSARLQIKLTAPVQQEFENGDGVFPDGLYLEFYGEPGQLTTTIKANYGKQDRNKDVYMVRGNVIVSNIQKKETLKTEELFWDKSKAQIYTDKFVTVVTPEEVITGEGLRAKQDFSEYSLKRVTGNFSIKE
ncbi:LPS export ABC transporter periplasmic protein LptC [Pontibacter arcticus]|uniref:LPS export ABC transporter periplasmic protein LptC n=2 Tax=Pontibacter arcticus TaxID=2080288 RepID=A0A364RIW8_9BACT|nr:LPS export ABC transporter periplasmic protein LptC [Pontibacter arcticus]